MIFKKINKFNTYSQVQSQQREMNKLFRLFMNEYEFYLDPKRQINYMQTPSKLLHQLQQNNPQNVVPQFVQTIKSKSANELKILQRLSLLSLLMLHSDKFYQIIMDVLPLEVMCNPKEKWISQNFSKPFEKFLLKCCSSSQLYQSVKKSNFSYDKDHITFQTIFYIINLLHQLFPSVQKISSLGRYYQKNTYLLTHNYVYAASAQAIRLYVSLKNIIHQMVCHPQIYLNTKEKQKIMKTILNQSLININEDMKNLILNKYFVPFRQGYKTRLFRNEQQSEKVIKTINGIINSHRDTARQNQKKLREQTIIDYNSFNDSFSPDNSFYPKIMQYSLGSSTSISLEKKDSKTSGFKLQKKPSFTIQVFQQNQQQIPQIQFD